MAKRGRHKKHGGGKKRGHEKGMEHLFGRGKHHRGGKRKSHRK